MAISTTRAWCKRRQPGQYGSAARNAVLGPGACNWDLSVQKKFSISGEKRNLEFRTDLFNVLNHANLGSPQANFGSSQSFGRITSTSAARIVQFALRYEF